MIYILHVPIHTTILTLSSKLSSLYLSVHVLTLANRIRLLLAVSNPWSVAVPDFSEAVPHGVLRELGLPASSSRYSDSKLLMEVALFNWGKKEKNYCLSFFNFCCLFTQTLSYIFERNFRRPVDSDFLFYGIVAATRNLATVILETLSIFSVGFFLQGSFWSCRKTPPRTKRFDLLDQVRLDVSVLQIIIPVRTVPWLHFVHVVQTLQSVQRYVHPTKKLTIVRSFFSLTTDRW